jgi:hypothetical protein
MVALHAEATITSRLTTLAFVSPSTETLPLSTTTPQQSQTAARLSSVPDALGRFGRFGGRYVPETLSAALDQLERAYEEAVRRDTRSLRARRALESLDAR